MRDAITSNYKGHSEKVKSILASCESVMQLNEQSNAYQKSKKRKYQYAYNAFCNYNTNMKTIRLYVQYDFKSSEKFEQESTSSKIESSQANVPRGIVSRVVDISIPEVFVDEDKQERMCFNCHLREHTYFNERCESGNNELSYVITFVNIVFKTLGDIIDSRTMMSIRERI